MEETVTVERMGNGAEAIAHLRDGKTVFVAGVAPGDVAKIEVVEDKATFARARVVSIEEASCVRVHEQPRMDATIGAPWAHLTYEAQLEAKRANVVDALVRTARLDQARVGELVQTCLPSKREWGYRNKLEMAGAYGVNGQFDRAVQVETEDSHDGFCIDYISSGYQIKIIVKFRDFVNKRFHFINRI